MEEALDLSLDRILNDECKRMARKQILNAVVALETKYFLIQNILKLTSSTKWQFEKKVFNF